jgi:hypothetical protein
MSQPLDSATPGRPPKVPFLGRERYVFMFLCSKIVGHSHSSAKLRDIDTFHYITAWNQTLAVRGLEELIVNVVIVSQKYQELSMQVENCE